MIKLIAFDLVGVLAYENDYLLTEVEDSIERLFGENPSDQDFIAKSLLYENNEAEIRVIISKIINNIYSVRDEHIVAKIKELRPDIKVVIATNHISAIREWIEKQSFYKDLDGIFISSELGCFKPNSDFYEIISRQMNIRKEEILLVDDSVKNIGGAELFDMQTCLYNKTDDLFGCIKKII